mmetsp:Transcript_29216/g.73242  ORF Transcript_29216/g.73242 Transcript_29216/m.73242 type:complete len:112 (+) Transcript_29216:905-1240(+)
MDKLYSWDDFNIFTLTELTDGHPLEVVATQIINDLDLPKQLNLDMGKFRNFVQAVELTYRAENSYHNNIHAADVTQSLAVLLSYEVLAIHPLSLPSCRARRRCWCLCGSSI